MDIHRRLGLKTLLAWSALAPAGAALAQERPATAPDLDALKTIFERFAGAKVDAIAPAPVAGLYEVIADGKVFYIDAAGERVVSGHIVDIASRQSLTAQREEAHRVATTPRLVFSELKLEDAITLTIGQPRPGRVLVSFEDPRCGFCKRLHVSLKDAKDLTLHIFPISFLGPESRALNERIWCSPSRPSAWQDAMAGLPVGAGPGSCGGFDALQRNMALAEHLRIMGTPTLFTTQGQRFDGLVGLDVLETALAAG